MTKMDKTIKNGAIAVMLTATDGRVCRWMFGRCTLAHVKELIKGYVEACHYDCEWTIKGDGKTIQGRSRN